MRRGPLFSVFMFGILLIAATSRSDVAATAGSGSDAVAVSSVPTGTGVPATPEPITGTAATPAPGAESTPKDPFAPYGVGAGGVWAYKDLTAAEQAVVDKGRDTTG